MKNKFVCENIKEKMRLKKKKVIVVIPAYQAGSIIISTVKGILKEKRVNKAVIVDDGSQDKTSVKVKKINSEKICLIGHKKNQGVGGAMKTGIAKALDMGADLVIKMDADNQMDPQFIPILIDKISSQEFDCCKGSRWQYGISRHTIPKTRLWGNTLLTLFTRFTTGYWKISDPNNGYIAWSKDILKKIDWSQVDNRYFFETSMLVQLNLLNAKITDIPMEPRYLGEESTMDEIRIIPKFLVNLFSYGVRRWWQKYFLYDMTAVSVFLLFGSILFLFGIIWGGWQWYWHAAKGIVTPTGTIMIAILPIFIGLNLIIQALVLDITNEK